jgi:hypothetical protein
MTNTGTFSAALIAAMLATASAHAGEMSKTERAAFWQRTAILPPEEYDYPYEGHLEIFRVEAERIPYVCPKTLYPLTLGCSIRFKPDPGAPLGSCHIVLALDDVINRTNWTPKIVLRHEVGHCNGWSKE